MKYLCLVYLSSEKWNACQDSACAAYADSLVESGHLLGGSPLHPVHTATSVRVRNGQITITDGPFAETKEALGGYYLISARDLDHALELARLCPSGHIEVRPVMDTSGNPA